eukprot:CAMPEP_0175067068 /NCGR_PEP_ID=MMETSP0052_2-20121109/16878_1 /TAXON_ID=51329 ORGANISM="Polytomella parva, Strain SAG 63-3" /NCGR_SAMPLE_ID=MMETSP0052_2 /ASSEMBLY_ACC=CAM_ASM_000194 /LENGTH=385 /DNA_ID=CAMNT_0016333879 /DNA_START=115 /DNA_END=1272 /DNA_ORIENTATION=-
MSTTGWGAFGAGAWSQHAENNFHIDQAQQQPLYNAPPPQNYDEQGIVAPVPVSSPAYKPAYPNYGGSQVSSAPATQPPPQPNPVAFPNSSRTLDIETREQALMAKEADLNRREKELAAQRAELEGKGLLPKKKNWPFFFPMIYHNISAEVPEHRRRPVREGYCAWMGLVWCLSWNIFCASVMLGQDANQKVPSWFLTIIYWITGVPISFYSWYRCLYNGAKVDSGFRFITFFALFAVHTAFCIWAAIAVPFSANQWSFCGFLTAIKANSHGTFPAVIFWVGAGFWSAEAVFSLWVIREVWWFFRSRKELETQVATNAAVAAAADGRGAFANNQPVNSSPAGGGGAPSWGWGAVGANQSTVMVSTPPSDQQEKQTRFGGMMRWGGK